VDEVGSDERMVCGQLNGSCETAWELRQLEGCACSSLVDASGVMAVLCGPNDESSHG
jgi:hypothetical protein